MPRSGSTSDRGYGAPHQERRARWAPLVAAGRVSCARCGDPIVPDTPWHLDHDDDDRSKYRGPAHQDCNSKAGAEKGNQNRRARDMSRGGATSLAW